MYDRDEMDEFRLRLRKAIKKFMEKEYEEPKFDCFHWDPDIERNMTDAAMLVLRAAIENQEYYRQEHGGD